MKKAIIVLVFHLLSINTIVSQTYFKEYKVLDNEASEFIYNIYPSGENTKVVSIITTEPNQFFTYLLDPNGEVLNITMKDTIPKLSTKASIKGENSTQIILRKTYTTSVQF